MTNREFYTAIIEANINDEMTEHAQSLLTKLDATNAKRAEKQTEKQTENLAKMAEVVKLLGAEPKTATDLHEAAGETVQKTSYLLRLAVKEGMAQVTDVKVPKKGTQKGYFVGAVPATDAVDTATPAEAEF